LVTTFQLKLYNSWDISWHFSHRYVIPGYSLALQPPLCNPWFSLDNSATVM